jgi:hypothetical protein
VVKVKEIERERGRERGKEKKNQSSVIIGTVSSVRWVGNKRAELY